VDRRRTIAAVALAALLGCSAGAIAGDPEPVPLQGAPLTAHTGLRLLVASVRPFVLDVDSGTVTPVTGIPGGRAVTTVVGISPDAAVVTTQRLDGTRLGPARTYVVRATAASAKLLAAGWAVAGGGDGRGVWVERRLGRGRCDVRLVRLDGSAGSATPRPVSCAHTVTDAWPLGLAVQGVGILDPATGKTVVRTARWIYGVAGGRAVVTQAWTPARPFQRIQLLDRTGHAVRSIRWPSILDGADGALPDPRGRDVALQFADPAWQLGGRQALDIWLLDLRSGRLRHVPGFPAFVHLKATDARWTRDGRLVLLGRADDRDVVAVWRPGQTRLALKTVELPVRDGGSDAFAVLR
jgi:hypothetical protein